MQSRYSQGLTAGQAARLKAQAEARERGEEPSAAGAWMFVVMVGLALAVLLLNAML